MTNQVGAKKNNTKTGGRLMLFLKLQCFYKHIRLLLKHYPWFHWIFLVF